jgi:hypothetical protein
MEPGRRGPRNKAAPAWMRRQATAARRQQAARATAVPALAACVGASPRPPGTVRHHRAPGGRTGTPAVPRPPRHAARRSQTQALPKARATGKGLVPSRRPLSGRPCHHANSSSRQPLLQATTLSKLPCWPVAPSGCTTGCGWCLRAHSRHGSSRRKPRPSGLQRHGMNPQPPRLQLHTLLLSLPAHRLPRLPWQRPTTLRPQLLSRVSARAGACRRRCPSRNRHCQPRTQPARRPQRRRCRPLRLVLP